MQPAAVRAVIFDMDGTLTRPMLDFGAIRREMGLTHPGEPILEAVEQMAAPQRRAAEAVLRRHEEIAAEQSTLNEGVAETLATLRGRGCVLGLLTRNCRRSVRTVLAKHKLSFQAVHTREDGALKPDPASIRQLCRRMGVAPPRTLMVGDYLYDLTCGRGAGCRTVLLIHGDRPDYADQADHVITRFDQLLELVDAAG